MIERTLKVLHGFKDSFKFVLKEYQNAFEEWSDEGRNFWKNDKFILFSSGSLAFLFLSYWIIYPVVSFFSPYLNGVGGLSLSFLISFVQATYAFITYLLFTIWNLILALLHFGGGGILASIWLGLWIFNLGILPLYGILLLGACISELFEHLGKLLSKKELERYKDNEKSLLNEIQRKEFLVSDVSDALICSICSCPYHATNAEKQPYSATCGHTYCYACWNKRTDDKCYMCRRSVGRTESLIKNLGMIQVIESVAKRRP